MNHPAGLFVALAADAPRFGFIVSKAVGNAVDRNRAKRVLREAARITLSRGVHADIVVKASREVLGYSVDELAAALEEAARSVAAR